MKENDIKKLLKELSREMRKLGEKIGIYYVFLGER